MGALGHRRRLRHRGRLVGAYLAVRDQGNLPADRRLLARPVAAPWLDLLWALLTFWLVNSPKHGGVYDHDRIGNAEGHLAHAAAK